MITERLKCILKNHLRQSKITKNQERWIENAKLTAKTTNQILRQFHPKSCLGSRKGTLDLSTTLHLQQRSTAQLRAGRQGPAIRRFSPFHEHLSQQQLIPFPNYCPLKLPWGPATGLQELVQEVLKVSRKLACHLTLFWHKLKTISLGYKHDCKIPLRWWNHFFCKLKITYLSNKEHSWNIFALSATQVPFPQIFNLV